MKIGNVEIDSGAFLAPMAGTTDTVYRGICKKYGAAMVYSEMISAKGLWYNDRKTASLMEIDACERPAAIQLFGSDPEIIAAVIPKVLEISKPDIIDINMGCPTPKIVNNGDGSALLKNPRLAGEIMNAAAKISPVPVTAKIRTGWDSGSVNAVETAKILEANGAAAVAVHGRTREQFYMGEADWNVIKEVKEAVKIPVIGNGDIFSAADAENMLDFTGCDAVMVGRGAEGNPFIFKQINELLKDGAVTYFPTPKERVAQAIEHMTKLCSYHGEYIGVRESRRHTAWYIKGLRNASGVKTRIFRAETLHEARGILSEYLTAVE